MLPVFLLSQFLRMSLHVSQRSLSPPPLASPHSWLLPAPALNVSLLANVTGLVSLPDCTEIWEAMLGVLEWPDPDWDLVPATLRQLRDLVSHSINLTSDTRVITNHFRQTISNTQPVCFLELLEQLELGHGELLCVGLLAVAGLNRCLGDCLGSSSSLTFLIRILLLPRGFWSRVLYAAGIAVLLTSEMFVLFWELNITNPHSEVRRILLQQIVLYEIIKYPNVSRENKFIAISSCGGEIREDFLTLLWSFDIYREMKTRHADKLLVSMVCVSRNVRASSQSGRWVHSLQF